MAHAGEFGDGNDLMEEYVKLVNFDFGLHMRQGSADENIDGPTYLQSVEHWGFEIEHFTTMSDTAFPRELEFVTLTQNSPECVRQEFRRRIKTNRPSRYQLRETLEQLDTVLRGRNTIGQASSTRRRRESVSSQLARGAVGGGATCTLPTRRKRTPLR
jgi:hypothetical protein